MSWSDISGIASAIAALCALVFSIVSFTRQQKRAEVHAAAVVRPILKIRTLKYENRKAVKLINTGIGPAIIEEAVFSKRGHSPTNNLVELFNFNSEFYWDTFTNVPKDTAIKVDEELVLVLLTANGLREQGIKEEQVAKIMEEWQRQKSGIEVKIKYKDVFDKKRELNEILT